MSTTFIPGHLATITIDAQDYTVTGNILGITSTRNTPRKPVFGQGGSKVVAGQQSWNGTASGHVAAEGPLTALLATYAKTALVAFSIQIGEAAGPTDAGILSGNCVLSSLNIDVDADGEWDYSFGFEIDEIPALA